MLAGKDHFQIFRKWPEGHWHVVFLLWLQLLVYLRFIGTDREEIKVVSSDSTFEAASSYGSIHVRSGAAK